MSHPNVLTHEEFASRALSKAGVPGGIDAFEGGDIEETVASIYWTLTDSLLTLTTWRFNTVTVQLSQLSAAPPSRWAYRYTLPADRLGDPMAFFPDKDVLAGDQDYEIFEDELWCDDARAYVVYQRRPASPGKWGAVFRDFALTALAAELALVINEDQTRYQRLKIQAYGGLDEGQLGGKLSLALMREASSTAPVQVMPGGGQLISARRGGG